VRPGVVAASAALLCLAASGATHAAASPAQSALLKHRTRTVLSPPTPADVDSRLIYAGRVDGASSGRVRLESSSIARPAWKALAVVRVAADGSFTYTTNVPGDGTYRIRAVFLGDRRHLPSSAVVPLQVI
jgi:hypothetical protein